MSNITEQVSKVVEELENIDERREKVIHLTRKLNRQSGRGIARIIKNKDYTLYLEKSRQLVKQIADLMQHIADITSWNITISGTEEYGEFEILVAILNSEKVPGPSELGIPSYIWISSLGDVIGELRRAMLNQLINQDLDRAETILELINQIYQEIAGLEFSKSLVPNLRRKVDIARTLIEKCESDFANATINKRT